MSYANYFIISPKLSQIVGLEYPWVTYINYIYIPFHRCLKDELYFGDYTEIFISLPFKIYIAF